ncbi:MAG TPA: hypothetical protein VNK49_12980 [Anaerolineales bacterium]|nr:hypothetical protein [Anaerolineales bacterium]
MESDNILLGALIFILLVVGSNVVMYAIARGAVKGGSAKWFSALKDTLSKPTESPSSRSMDELRKRVEELEKRKNGA